VSNEFIVVAMDRPWGCIEYLQLLCCDAL